MKETNWKLKFLQNILVALVFDRLHNATYHLNHFQVEQKRRKLIGAIKRKTWKNEFR